MDWKYLKKKLPVGDGDDPGPQLLGHLICLFTLIINIYGLGWSRSPFFIQIPQQGGVEPRGYKMLYAQLHIGISTLTKY